MKRREFITLVGGAWISGIGALLPAYAAPISSRVTLPRNVIVSLSVVNRVFPEITREVSTGRNSTATGNPKATRSTIYATGDGAKKVTITVDQYASSREASSAYQQAVEKSQSVAGFKRIHVPNLGQQAFAGTVTMDAETHVGLGALDDRLIVGATLAGYDATPDNTAKLIEVARMEAAAASYPWLAAGAANEGLICLRCRAHVELAVDLPISCPIFTFATQSAVQRKWAERRPGSHPALFDPWLCKNSYIREM